MFANMPAMAKRWAAETPNIKSLPEHVGKLHARAIKHHKQARKHSI